MRNHDIHVFIFLNIGTYVQVRKLNFVPVQLHFNYVPVLTYVLIFFLVLDVRTYVDISQNIGFISS